MPDEALCMANDVGHATLDSAFEFLLAFRLDADIGKFKDHDRPLLWRAACIVPQLRAWTVMT